MSVPSNTPRIITIVLTWNSELFIEDCIDSLLRSDLKTDLLVIDNDSSDNTIKIINSKYPSIRTINTGSNLGYSGGNNFGIKIAEKENPDYIFILNPDAIVDSKCIENLVNRLQNDKLTGAVSPKIYHHNSKKVWFGGSYIKWHTGETIQYTGDDTGQFDDNYYTERLNGCAMLLRISAIEKTGLMDERFFLYYEESDWSVSFKENGFQNGFQPDAIVWHKVSSSSGGPKSKLYQYYMHRNRLLFVEKHKRHLLPVVIFWNIFFDITHSAYVAKNIGLKDSIVYINISAKAYLDYIFRKFGRRI
jgi:GT2 family glycosyltransferase